MSDEPKDPRESGECSSPGCGGQCWVTDGEVWDEHGPCSGYVIPIEELYDGGWIHECEAHEGVLRNMEQLIHGRRRNSG